MSPMHHQRRLSNIGKSQVAARVRGKSKLYSPVNVRQKRYEPPKPISRVTPLKRLTEEERPSISLHPRRRSQNLSHDATAPSQKVQLLKSLTSIDSKDDVIVDHDQTPIVSHPVFRSNNLKKRAAVNSPSLRAKVFRSTISMQALLPLPVADRIPRNQLSMRIESSEILHDSIRADKKVECEKRSSLVTPQLHSRPSFVLLSSIDTDAAKRNDMLRREHRDSQVHAPASMDPHVVRVNDLRVARPSFVVPSLSKGCRRQTHTKPILYAPIEPSISVNTLEDAPKDLLDVHILDAYPDHLVRTSFHAGIARPRIEPIRRVYPQNTFKVVTIRKVPTPCVTKSVFEMLQMKNLEAKQKRAEIQLQRKTEKRNRILHFLKMQQRRMKKTNNEIPPMSRHVREILRALSETAIMTSNSKYLHLHYRIRTLKQKNALLKSRQRSLKLLNKVRLRESEMTRVSSDLFQ